MGKQVDKLVLKIDELARRHQSYSYRHLQRRRRSSPRFRRSSQSGEKFGLCRYQQRHSDKARVRVNTHAAAFRPSSRLMYCPETRRPASESGIEFLAIDSMQMVSEPSLRRFQRPWTIECQAGYCARFVPRAADILSLLPFKQAKTQSFTEVKFHKYI
ncbi:unnamed protein product [Mesocestoides corti]|uniref:Uncharacterized protein n=1 Tax=Mesocestoides corti TaxID=53468 RepID=A0A0R3U4P4_MESCO|nr:unnamed protein product [Mesocestoides corti]